MVAKPERMEMLGSEAHKDLAGILAFSHFGASIHGKSDVGVCNKGSLERLYITIYNRLHSLDYRNLGAFREFWLKGVAGPMVDGRTF